MWLDILIHITTLQLLTLGQETNDDENWRKECPLFCTCSLTDSPGFPVTSFTNHHLPVQEESEIYHPNEVLLEDNIHEENFLLDKNSTIIMATCILTPENANNLFSQLPNYLQALTILQSKNSGNISLRSNHFKHLWNLLSLNIQGYEQEENHLSKPLREKTQENIFVHYDVLNVLKSLQYINFQHVQLIGGLKHQNFPYAINIENNIPVLLQEKWQKKNLHLLTFIPPENEDDEVLPYNMYKKQEPNDIFSFSHLTNLVFLRLYACQIEEISWEMFENLNKLLYISLENNQILFIPDFTFYGTPNLKRLILTHNKLLSLQSTSLAGLLDLEILDVSFNNISHLSELSLPPFPKLRVAYFTNNPLETIFSNTFEIMNQTKEMYIGSNITEFLLQPSIFVGLESLKLLHIKNVRCASLERELLHGMSNLKEIKTTGTINSLSYDAFVEVPKLETIIMKYCKIKIISMDAFYGLNSLLHLDLSSNLLEYLPPGLFDQQTSLVELELQNNMLTKLPIGIFNFIPAKLIRLEGNPWKCSCSMMDWKPEVINIIKIIKKKPCSFQYDKGSGCLKHPTDVYVYDNKVTPKCATPIKYAQWSVFHVLRKEMRCIETQNTQYSDWKTHSIAPINYTNADHHMRHRKLNRSGTHNYTKHTLTKISKLSKKYYTHFYLNRKKGSISSHIPNKNAELSNDINPTINGIDHTLLNDKKNKIYVTGHKSKANNHFLNAGDKGNNIETIQNKEYKKINIGNESNYIISQNNSVYRNLKIAWKSKLQEKHQEKLQIYEENVTKRSQN